MGLVNVEGLRPSSLVKGPGIGLEVAAMSKLPDRLIRILGKGKKAPVMAGDLVPKWEGADEYTPVEAIYRDFLGNEIWASSFTLREHIPQGLTPQRASRILENIPKVLEDPDWVLLDTRSDPAVVYYVKEVAQGAVPPWSTLYFCVVGVDSLKLYTAKNKKIFFQKTGERFMILYEKARKDKE